MFGSIVPDRVLDGSPSSGENPIVVSIDRPFCMAHILHPLPR